MKTKWHLYILWSVLSLGLLSCAVDTYESPFSRRKKVFKVGTPKSKPIKLSTTGDRRSSPRLPASTSGLSSRRPYPPPAPVTPPSVHPGDPRAMIPSGFASLPDVSVTCSSSDFVVRVKPAFYGLGADAEELKLGTSCKSNGVLRPYGDLLFTYPLTACDAVRQSPRGHLVYKYVLHYEPSAKRFPSRAHRVDVDIECRYQRNHHVHQLTVQPTWETVIVRKKLKGSPKDFLMELMDDSWSRPARSQVYQLGKTLHFQVSAPHLPSKGKLYINSCYARPSSGSKSSLKYIIIDNFGCMRDSKTDPGASQFISRTDKTLRFSLKAFQFTSDPDAEVNIHCKLFVTSEAPSPAHKSCTYRGNRWKALTGDDSICECCDSQCVTSKPRRAMMEGSASSGSLLVSDQPYTAEDGFLPVSKSRAGKTIISHYTDEDLWGSEEDEEEQVETDDEEEEEQVDTDEEEEEQVDTDEEEEQVDTDEEEEEEQVNMDEEEEEEEEDQVDPDDDDKEGKQVDTDDEEEEQVDTDEEEEEQVDTDEEEEQFDEEEQVDTDEEEEEEQFEEESGIILKVMTKHDLDESGFRERVLEEEEPEVKDSNLFEEDGSSSGVNPQRELQPLVSEGEEENRKHMGRGEEDDRMKASEVEGKNDEDDGEMTWYFHWR